MAAPPGDHQGRTSEPNHNFEDLVAREAARREDEGRREREQRMTETSRAAQFTESLKAFVRMAQQTHGAPSPTPRTSLTRTRTGWFGRPRPEYTTNPTAPVGWAVTYTDAHEPWDTATAFITTAGELYGQATPDSATMCEIESGMARTLVQWRSNHGRG